ncbi:DUF6438 domain-containing protein [Hymenobacter sp. DG25A]|uniref:DUF6438 domain-containing protein n=1 Tax=Hymenobacter sp. DG25A TaxID=1385663 RepID=UPI0006BDEFBF|nr:DUF6438 domain-containing protein [Hymenobacter sp. DG25A]ALD20371.1 hypothetical protein AM218_02890 [Hymenobacter sp. DG25A]
MRFLLGFLLLMGFAHLPACAQQGSTNKPIRYTPPKTKPAVSAPQVLLDTPVVAPKTQASAKLPILIFEKTPCFGRCPAYKATVYRNGRLSYEGLSNVPLLGQHELQLPAATVNHILKEAQRIGFARLQGVYSQNTSDLPSTYISILQPDCNLKEVRVEEGAPEELNKLLQYVHEQIMKVALPPTK